MAFDQQKFQQALDKTDGSTKFEREGGLNSIQDQFKNMSTSERAEALDLIRQHNEKSSTQVAVELKRNAEGQEKIDVSASKASAFFGVREEHSQTTADGR